MRSLKTKPDFNHMEYSHKLQVIAAVPLKTWNSENSREFRVGASAQRCICLQLEAYGCINNRAAILPLPKVTSKILSELAGIRMAATSGDRSPCTANERPTTL